MSQTQSTFDDIRKRQSLEHLTDKQKRIVRLLMEGQTQSSIAKTMRISRSSVSQAVLFFERNNLIKKHIGTKYNVIYEVSAQLQRKSGGVVQEPLTACRVHNIALKFHILNQDHPVSKEQRSGYSKSWLMRGKIEWSSFWFPGKAGETSCTVTVYPRSILIRMDAKQKIIAKDVPDAESRGFQHLIHIRQKFIEQQRAFGVHLEIEPTGRRIGKVHGGFALTESNPVVQEGVTEKGWWIDKSASELEPGKVELESHLEGGGPTRLDKLIQTSEQFSHLPDLIKSCISPLSEDIQRVEALVQGGTTSEQKVNQLMGVIGSLLERLLVLEKKLDKRG